MKTIRFAKIVQACGEPESYLVLMDPAKDRTLQKAVKANRVMTVFQQTTGTKADHGEVGFKPGPARQFLVFPKSLRAFEHGAIVGIKYELLNSSKAPESDRSAAPLTHGKPEPKPKPKRQPKPKSQQKPEPKPKREPKVRRQKPPVSKPKPSPNILKFKPHEDEDTEDHENESEEITAIKEQIRQAMSLLEEGKPVAAFNLLKRIV